MSESHSGLLWGCAAMLVAISRFSTSYAADVTTPLSLVMRGGDVLAVWVEADGPSASMHAICLDSGCTVRSAELNHRSAYVPLSRPVVGTQRDGSTVVSAVFRNAIDLSAQQFVVWRIAGLPVSLQHVASYQVHRDSILPLWDDFGGLHVYPAQRGRGGVAMYLSDDPLELCKFPLARTAGRTSCRPIAQPHVACAGDALDEFSSACPPVLGGARPVDGRGLSLASAGAGRHHKTVVTTQARIHISARQQVVDIIPPHQVVFATDSDSVFSWDAAGVGRLDLTQDPWFFPVLGFPTVTMMPGSHRTAIRHISSETGDSYVMLVSSDYDGDDRAPSLVGVSTTVYVQDGDDWVPLPRLQYRTNSVAEAAGGQVAVDSSGTVYVAPYDRLATSRIVYVLGAGEDKWLIRVLP